MLYDDLNMPEKAEPGFVPGKPSSKPDSSGQPAKPVADREVPLPVGHTAMLTHQWLDGEISIAAVRATAGGNDAADLWTKINDEAELLRSRTTPLYVHKRIMESLPDDMYRLNQPWYRRPIMLNPAMMILAAATLLGLGVLVARVAAH